MNSKFKKILDQISQMNDDEFEKEFINTDYPITAGSENIDRVIVGGKTAIVLNADDGDGFGGSWGTEGFGACNREQRLFCPRIVKMIQTDCNTVNKGQRYFTKQELLDIGIVGYIPDDGITLRIEWLDVNTKFRVYANDLSNIEYLLTENDLPFTS